MKKCLVIYGVLCCVISAGIWSVATDAWAGRRFNSEDVQKQLESAGVNPDEIRKELESGSNTGGSQTREERLEALRNQNGSADSGTYGKSATDVKIPTRTHVMAKLDKTLDSSEMGEGEQFTGRLQGDLVVDNFLLSSSGSKVYGTIVTSTRARNAAGTSVIEFKLVGILIDNQMRSIESSRIKVESEKSGRLQASASIEADTVIEFSIGEVGSDVGGGETISGPDKKATDRVEERQNSRRHRRD